MNHQRKTIFSIGAATAVMISVAVIALPALATDPGSFSPSQIFKGVFGPLDVKAEKAGKWDLMLKSKGLTDLRVTQVSFGPHSSSGWHSHPGPNLLTVTAGEVIEYEGSDPLCTATTYHTGDTFGDNGGSTIHLVRNATHDPAVVMAVAFYPHATGTPPIPAPSTPKTRPTNCVNAPVN